MTKWPLRFSPRRESFCGTLHENLYVFFALNKSGRSVINTAIKKVIKRCEFRTPWFTGINFSADGKTGVAKWNEQQSCGRNKFQRFRCNYVITGNTTHTLPSGIPVNSKPFPAVFRKTLIFPISNLRKTIFSFPNNDDKTKFSFWKRRI